MDGDDIITVICASFIFVGILCCIGVLYTETTICDDTIDKTVTITHTFTEMRLGTTHYYFVGDKEYQMYGNNQRMRFHSLECNQTYRIAVNCGVSCSEELIEE